MKTSRRIAWLLIILGSGLFLGVVFRAFIFANLVVPIALVFWLLWRVVLSVHQALYWGLLLVGAGGLAAYRLAQITAAIEDTSLLPAPDTILRSIGYWRTSLLANNNEGEPSMTLRRELGRLVVSIYTSKHPEARGFDQFEALRLRQVALPDSVYTFLFEEDSPAARRTWKRRLQRLAQTPARWMRRWTGRDKAEYYQSIEEMLTFMEALVETKHADDIDTSHH